MSSSETDTHFTTFDTIIVVVIMVCLGVMLWCSV